MFWLRYQVLLLLTVAGQVPQQSFSFCLNSPSLATHRKTATSRNGPLRSNNFCPTQTVSMTSSFLEEHDEKQPGGGAATATSGTVLMLSATNDHQDSNDYSGGRGSLSSLRSRMRRATGFSMTAFRATMRAATGISLTAVYASALAATSAFVRETMALILSPLPPWFRYFLQPFLILYYAPLFILRNLAGPTGKRARETHEILVDGFKSAVDAAEKKADGYWPVHVTEEGDIVSVDPPQQSAKQLDVNEGIAKSMEVVLEDGNDENKA